MKNKLVYLVLLLLAINANAKVIAVDILFQGPEYNSFKISPRGDYIAGHRYGEGSTQIVIGASNISKINIVLRKRNDGNAISYDWIDNNTLYVNYKNRDNFKQLLIDVSESNKNIVTKRKKINLKGYLVDLLPEVEDTVMMAYSKIAGDRYNVYKVNLRSLNSTSDISSFKIENRGMLDATYYKTDAYHQVRLAGKRENDQLVFYYRKPERYQWAEFYRISDAKSYVRLLGFINESTVAMLTNEGRDKKAVVAYDIVKKKYTKTLYESPLYDISYAKLDGHTGKLASVSLVEKGKIKVKYLNYAEKNTVKAIIKSLESDSIFIFDRSVDNQHMLLFSYSTINPGTYYYFDKAKRTVHPIADAYPDLQSATLQPTQVLQIKGKDNIVIEAFLTLPADKTNVFPLVVMPHGGPIGVRDIDGFQPEVQYFASRGLAILRVNYRGSYGYGKTFLEKGIGQWGLGIEEDIDLAVNYVLKNYAINKNKLCILGGSYGGYSALMSTIKYPKKYQCVASYFGVTDIPLLFTSSNQLGNKQLRKRIVDVVGEPGEVDHKAVSPFYLSNRINIPVLLMAGFNDRIADVEHTNRLYYWLQKTGKSVDYVLYSNAGHGHTRWGGEWHQYINIYDFLFQHLDLSAPKNAEDLKVIAKEYYFAGNIYVKGRVVKQNYKKAMYYFSIASNMGDAESQYKMGYLYEWGKGVAADYNNAIYWYKKSATLGSENAFLRLGKLYLYGGLGQSVNYALALEYIRKAIDLDSDKAKLLLADVYEKGLGIEKNLGKALELRNSVDIET